MAALGPREKELLSRLGKASSLVQENQLGVLYEQSGLLAKTAEQSENAISSQEFKPNQREKPQGASPIAAIAALAAAFPVSVKVKNRRKCLISAFLLLAIIASISQRRFEHLGKRYHPRGAFGQGWTLAALHLAPRRATFGATVRMYNGKSYGGTK